PALKHVFNIDVTGTLKGEYNQFIWTGLIKARKTFGFNDNKPKTLPPLTNWAFLLHMRQNPRLGWFYNYLKKGETLQDVLYDTKNVPQNPPFDENPDHIFWQVGTTDFKSGWSKNAFSFVMRTGAFYNHQHL